MTADQAAAALLAGRPHGATDREEWHPDFAPTTDVEAWRLELVEKPVTVPGGCARQRWTIRFLYRLDAPADRRLPDVIHATPEVALSPGGACGVGPTYVPSGLPPAEGVAALARLDAVVRGRARVHLACTDTTGSNLCAGDAALRRALAAMTPWSVGRGDSGVGIGLRDGDRLGTTVNWSPATPGTVTVRRQIPAPF